MYSRGTGAAIKAARATGAVSNIAGGVLTIQDGIENNNNLEVDYIIATPRMSYYIKYSTEIYNVYLKYFASF